MKIKKYESIVLDVLQFNERASQDDFVLYGAVLRRLGVDLKNTSLFEFLSTADSKGMPSFETITRCRRHIQCMRTDLQDDATAVARQNKIDDYVAYNRSGIGEN